MARPEYSAYYLNKEGSEKVLDVAEGFSKLTDWLEAITPKSRYQELIKTHLEIACMFARKALAEMPEHQHGYNPNQTELPLKGELS